jgi:hypothetical protein
METAQISGIEKKNEKGIEKKEEKAKKEKNGQNGTQSEPQLPETTSRPMGREVLRTGMVPQPTLKHPDPVLERFKVNLGRRLPHRLNLGWPHMIPVPVPLQSDS